MPEHATELIGVSAGILLVFYSIGFLIIRRMNSSSNVSPFFHLMQPILPAEQTAVRLRLDAALRDAEEGFHACAVCGFENLKRNIFCSLCGSVLDIGDPSTDALSKDSQLARLQLVSAKENRRRKSRALKRKEWVRAVDVEGKLFWFRDGTNSGGEGAQQQQPGYVVLFAGEPLVSPTLEELQPDTAEVQQQPEDDVSPNENASSIPAGSNAGLPPPDDHPRESIVEVDEDETPTTDEATGATARRKPRMKLVSLKDAQEIIDTEMASRPLTLVDSSSASPGRPAVVVTADSVFAEDAKTLVYNTKLDFPSKMAEFVMRTSKAVTVAQQSFLRISVHRDKVLRDSIEALASLPAAHSRCPIRMVFIGEQGVDAGGVYREWLELISQQLVAPTAGIFRCVDSRDRAYYLNPTSRQDIGDHHLAHFFAVGRLLGRMLLEGNVTGFHLALPLLKIIIGQPVTFSDLEYFDPDAFKNLSWLLNNDGIDTLGLDFTVTEQTASGETIVVELVPNGSTMDVTDANKREYVDLKLKYLLFGSVQHQLFAFLKGLYEVMPPELLMMFDAEELDFVLSGSDEIDVDDWKRNTKSTVDLMEHPVLGWFWEIVREMPNEYRRRLLLFATGSSRVPLAGFAALTSYDGRLCPFTLKGFGLDFEGGYIRSHACFNQLDLPRFYKKKDLEAVLYGVLDTDQYGFTSA